MKQSVRSIQILLPMLIIVAWTLNSCEKGNMPPVASLVAFPAAADTSVLFDFSAEGSKDDKDYKIGLVFRWDFNGDGNWDTEFAKSSTIAHKYAESGIYAVAVEVKDLDGLTGVATDTIEVYRYNTDIDTLTDPRDGNRYRIVMIKGRWWMAENLRYGTEIFTDQEQTDNGMVEFYRNPQSKYRDTVGGVYLWHEAMNYRRENPQGICPDGWHIPTAGDWQLLFPNWTLDSLYMARKRIGEVLYYRKGGPSNLNLDLNNGAERWDDGSYWWAAIESEYRTGFWSSDSFYDPEFYEFFPSVCFFNSKWLHVVLGIWHHGSADSTPLTSYLSVRCIKNQP